jgi:hypothetical protein
LSAWLAALLVWTVAATCATGLLVLLGPGARRPGSAVEAVPDVAETGPDPTDPIVGAADTIIGLLDGLLLQLVSQPEAFDRVSWIEDLLSEGYVLALMLETEAQRMGWDSERVLARNEPYAERQVVQHARRQRAMRYRARALRARLDELTSRRALHDRGG